MARFAKRTSLLTFIALCALAGCSNDSSSTADATEALVCATENVREIEGRSYCVLPKSDAECPDATPDRFVGVSAIVCAPVSTRNVDLPLELCEEAGYYSCEQLSYRPGIGIDIVRSCGDGKNPYFPRCEEVVGDSYSVHETGECLEPCVDGECSDGKTCLKASLRTCDYGGCDPCQPELGVCVEGFELSGQSEVDGNGIVAWESSPDINDFRGALFQASGGTYTVQFVSRPIAIGVDTPFGGYSRAMLIVIDPNVYDLHSLPADEISDVNQAALEQAVVEDNFSSFAGSCEYRVLYRSAIRDFPGGDRERYAWLEPFPQGYSCARVAPPVNGNEVYELVDCSEVTLKQGECVGTGGNP